MLGFERADGALRRRHGSPLAGQRGGRVYGREPAKWQRGKRGKPGQSLQVNGGAWSERISIFMGGFDDSEPPMSNPQASPSILDHFSALSDPRQSWRVLYPLPEVLLLVLCATLSGMEDFVEIRLWGEQRLDFLRRFLPYERGIPAHDTLNDVTTGSTRNYSRPALPTGSKPCASTRPTSLPLTARRRGDRRRARCRRRRGRDADGIAGRCSHAISVCHARRDRRDAVRGPR